MLLKFKKKFEQYKKYEHKMPGIHQGLKILSHLNKQIIDVSALAYLDFLIVKYYDFNSNKIIDCCYNELNFSLNSLYIEHVLNDKVLLYNKLYSINYSILESSLKKNNYYIKEQFILHDILNKFIHGLRRSKNIGNQKFFVLDVLSIFRIPYFNEITLEQFHLLMTDFIVDLYLSNILFYDYKDHSIIFRPQYIDDLNNLLNVSFDIIKLGKSNIHNNYDLSEDDTESNLIRIYEIYNLSNEERKIYINDLLISLVISSSVNYISAPNYINNIFIESVIKGNNK